MKPNLTPSFNFPFYHVLNKILYQRFFRSNKNIIGIVYGPTGSGKSWACLSMVDAWYTNELKRPFTIKNVCFSIDEVITRLQSNELKRGDVLILEEGGVNMGNLDFQNKMAKAFNYVLQSFRSKNIGLIINLPYFSFLNKSTRMLAHIRLECLGVDTGNRTTMLKPLLLHYNNTSGKEYAQFPKIEVGNKRVKVKRLSYPAPRRDLIDEYEENKDKFVNKTIANVAVIDKKNEPTEQQVQVWYLRHVEGLRMGEIAKRLNMPPSNITRTYNATRFFNFTKESIKKYDFYLENLKNLSDYRILAPVLPNIGKGPEKIEQSGEIASI